MYRVARDEGPDGYPFTRAGRPSGTRGAGGMGRSPPPSRKAPTPDTLPSTMKYACIDIVGSDRPADVIYFDDDSRRLWHEQYGGADDDAFLNKVVAGILKEAPHVLAIDAPSKRNSGQLTCDETRKRHDLKPVGSKAKYTDFRVCEMLLKRLGIGLYNTPNDLSSLSGWVRRGFQLYEALTAEGYVVWDAPGLAHVGPITSRTILEVHPHACFVVGLGWIPQDKQTLAGQLERCAWLARSTHGLAVAEDAHGLLPSDETRRELARRIGETSWESIATSGIDLPAFSHDRLDALAGLVTAVEFASCRAHAIGEPEEGVIVVPASPIGTGTYPRGAPSSSSSFRPTHGSSRR